MVDSKLFPQVVLIVDDDANVLDVMKRHLEIDGYGVIGLQSARDIEETIKKTTLLAVLLDLGLPMVDGFQILQKIKSIKPNLPVIIVTGRHEEQEARRAFELGAWDYVTKPIDFNYLKNILRTQSP